MTDLAGVSMETNVTKQLYNEAPYDKEFTARVISAKYEKGRVFLILDQTLFFPEGGGQDSDTGIIEGHEVEDVQITDGIITHAIKMPAKGTDDSDEDRESGSEENVPSCFTPGSAVKGCINWQKRFSNMQNHTGEHILSGILHNNFNSENVGFHLSENTVTLDTSRFLTPQMLEELEVLANRAVYDDLRVTIAYPDAEELEKIAYRSKGEIEGPVRIVTIGDLDCCACCAPHLHSTGEAGIIKIIKAIKWKNGTRIWFLCGERALSYIQEIFKNVEETAHITSETPERTAYGVRRLTEDIAELKAQLFSARSEILNARIAAIPEDRDSVILFEEVNEPKVLRNAVNAMTKDRTGFCGVFAPKEEGWQFVIGSREKDCREVSEVLKARFDAKGGGKAEMVQGSLTASREEIVGALFEECDIYCVEND